VATGTKGDFERGAEARGLIRRAGYGALGTSFEGRPYVSLVAIACDYDASPLMLLSNLAQHTRNLTAESQVSLLFDGTREFPDPLAGPRLTLIGRAERCDNDRLLRRFAARHPGSGVYAGFADFHLYRVAIERGHFVAGFGRIGWVEGAELRYAGPAAAIAAAEAEIVVHMNQDHADAVGLFANTLLGRPGDGWRMTAIDPEGIDLRRRDDAASEYARLDFAAPIFTPIDARATLIALTQGARARQ
jgi:putative heme iron utilization protein